MFSEISGGVSTELLKRDIDIAVKSEKVSAILLDIDSPGGTVDGTQALADTVFEARGQKPIFAFANGEMASAAYWIGSGADKIISEPTAVLGSIGVVSMHYDFSGSDEKAGVKRTVLTAGKYKAMGNDTEPLNKESKDYMQSILDTYYSIFVNDVARNRGVSNDTVLKDMADGRLFIGTQGLDAGLVDVIGGFEKAFDLARSASDSGSKNIKGGIEDMANLAEIKKTDPDGYAALIRDVQAAVQAEHEAEVTGLREQVQERDSQLEAKDAEIVAQEKRLLKLEKINTLRDERDRKDSAERIWDDELSASDIPTHLYKKVKKQVRYTDFVTKDEDGKVNFDDAGFREAVKTEILDGWPAARVIGGGGSPRDLDTDPKSMEEEESEALADSLVAMA
jgi:signal peptide peptidase SppA